MTRADRRAELQAQHAGALAARLEELLPVRGDERVLDVGAGTGAFAFAIAPRARADAPTNVEVVVGDGEHLPFESFEFDIAATLRTLHHTRRPELLVAELV